MTGVQRFLERKLKLKVNQDNSQVARTDQTDFLGFTFNGVKIRWSDKAFQEFKRRVKELTGRSSMEYRLSKLAQYLRGWMNYFGITEYYRPIPEIDHWLRRRYACATGNKKMVKVRRQGVYLKCTGRGSLAGIPFFVGRRRS